MKDNQLSIRLHGQPIGILAQDNNGKKTFSYNDTASTAISLSMPIRKEAYQDPICEAFFGGLLPENQAAKQLIGKQYGVSYNNSFSLLKAIGYDCAGAISCHAIDDPVIPQEAIPLQAKIINEEALYKHIKELPKKPLFMDIEGLRLSLAGVQDKAAVCLVDNQIALPENGCPTTHILKPASAHFQGLAENEYFIMKLAKHIGIATAEVELRKIKDISFLLIKRYDRYLKNDFIERIHQEDFCQALSVLSSQKYQKEGGPSLKNCFGLLDQSTQPAINRNQLMMTVIFNYLIGNMDAHGKNFSLLHHSEHTQLTPAYDLVCTRVYESLTTNMAMKIGGKYQADLVLPRHWLQLSEEIHYRYLALASSIKKLAKQILLAAEEEKKHMQALGFDHPIINQIMYFIEHNINNLLKRFDNE